MKQYSLSYSLTRVGEQAELWALNVVYVYGPFNEEGKKALNDTLKENSDLVSRVIEQDVQGPFTLGHVRVAMAVEHSLQSVDALIAREPSFGERVLTVKSDIDMSTNYLINLKVSEVITNKPRNRIVERFARLLRGE